MPATGHLAVRTLLSAGRDNLLSIKGAVKAGTFTITNSDPYSRVYNLQHHIDRLPVEEVSRMLKQYLLSGTWCRCSSTP